MTPFTFREGRRVEGEAKKRERRERKAWSPKRVKIVRTTPECFNPSKKKNPSRVAKIEYNRSLIHSFAPNEAADDRKTFLSDAIKIPAVHNFTKNKKKVTGMSSWCRYPQDQWRTRA